ncbi:hypothetical protein ACGFW5_11985 [Streptomyces sp. NPDC048416]|uniref:hypothetical protein n=1 Tax=Streptomyces sp. NPDC048416 TaxID=3365546 RepID=UPI0037104EED
MGKAEKIRNKAQQAAEQAKTKASRGREQMSERTDDPAQQGRRDQERAERMLREAGTDHT